jgi:hypothetical protein
MTSSERLTACLDDLASSLHRAGVSGDAAARLLELSALATMKAVELEVRAAGRNVPAGQFAPVGEPSVLLRLRAAA